MPPRPSAWGTCSCPTYILTTPNTLLSCAAATTVARGTYAAMAERLDHLQALGVNAIELLPVHEFNELEYYSPIGDTGRHRVNFWGYSTVGYFAPMAR